ncbi:MAG: hypothetical protein JWM10_764 [Myxococcaceae bacterium]|nr:hypothetical protein [Myxococcaceae bacterium]
MTIAVTWTGWLSWAEVNAPTATIQAALRQTGAYLVACSPERPMESPTPALADIVYIGETHRRGRSLRQRLFEFGKSAGFTRADGSRRSGHSGGWRWPPEHAKGVGAGSCWIAIAPTPTRATEACRAIREIYPTCVESESLLAYVTSQRRLPALNRRERSGKGSDLPELEVDVGGLLAGNLDAANAFVEQVASRWGTRAPGSADPSEVQYKTRDWSWRGVERELDDRWWIGVGWSAGAEAVVDVWVWRSGERDTFWETAATEDEVHELIELLTDWWCSA